ncbi:MAG TPA: hypothetical protein VI299_19730 [Polyangiales bacterium]
MDELQVEAVEVWGDVSLFEGAEGRTPRRRDNHQAQLVRWIGETLAITARVASSGQAELLPVFWIRLYGLLTDVADFVELASEQSYDGLCMFPQVRARQTRSKLPTALHRLKSVFEEDELLYIEYRRHAECDPFVTKYRPRRGVPAHVPSVLLEGRPITVEQARAAFDRLLALHGREERVGSAFASRVLPALHAVDAAARAE